MTPADVEFALIKHFEQKTQEPKLTITDTGAEYVGILGTYEIDFKGNVKLNGKEFTA